MGLKTRGPACRCMNEATIAVDLTNPCLRGSFNRGSREILSFGSVSPMEILEAPTTVPGNLLDEWEIASEVVEIASVIDRLMQQLVASECCDPRDCPKVRLCLEEALTNAVIHGNRCQSGKSVQVSLWHDDDSWGVVVRDQGDGFVLEAVDVELSEETLWQYVGRGIPLMAYHMDEVVYHDGGRTVLIRNGKNSS